MTKTNNYYVGAHVSCEGGVFNGPVNASKIGASAFAMFTANPRSYTVQTVSDETANLFKQNLAKANILPSMVLPHDNFLINLASQKHDVVEKSIIALRNEALNVQKLGLNLLNFHPGSPSDGDKTDGMKQIATHLKQIITDVPDVTFVLETTAGQGNHLGRSFEEIAFIIEQTARPERFGVCIDTCHIFAAGYDVRTSEAWEDTWAKFDKILGPSMLKGMHINDSMKDFDSHVDRHAQLGKGFIGLDCFKWLMNQTYMQNIPLVLETPDPSMWAEEIKLLYSFIE